MHQIQGPGTGHYVAVVGHVGTNKSIFARQLSQLLSSYIPTSLHIEDTTHNSPYLQDFYHHPHRWGFHSQTHIMIGLAANLQRFAEMNPNPILIADHLPGYEDIMVYSKFHYDLGYLSEREWNTLQDAFSFIKEAVPHPSVVILMKARDLALLQKEIVRRGRVGDKEMTLDYIVGLDARFSAMVGSISDTYRINVTVEGIEASPAYLEHSVRQACHDILNFIRKT